MSKLEQIEKAFAQLDRQELEAFSLWFEEFQAERWERKIEKDKEENELDRLTKAALNEFRAGKQRTL
ncbi:hypothetical protein, partial [Neorhizobium galegae]|uniref:hypothetical protein n=1 Tax=Neorhizobium galegae TaxID=399 RepID=UPI0021080CA7